MTEGTLIYLRYRRLLRESVRAFQAARDLGYGVALVGPELPPPLEQYVDAFLPWDGADLDSLARTVAGIRSEGPVAGVVCFTETAVEAAAWVVDQLGLIGLPLVAVGSVRDKAILRSRAKTVELVESHIVDDREGLSRFMEHVGLPIVIKPVNTSGSTGIFLIRQPGDLDLFWSNRAHVPNPTYDPISRRGAVTFVAERYLSGQEVSVEGFVHKGETTIVGVTHKETSDPYRLEVSHIFPADIEPATLRVIEDKTRKLVAALSLDNTSFHLEGKYTSVGFSLIEVAARPGGDYIASHLIPLATGYDFYGSLARISVGDSPEVPRRPSRVAGIHYILAEREGTLTDFVGLDDVMCHPWVEHVFPEQHLGAKITLPPRDFRTQRLVGVVSTAPSQALLEDHFRWVQRHLTPVIR